MVGEGAPVPGTEGRVVDCWAESFGGECGAQGRHGGEG